MSTELFCLVASAALSLALPLVYGPGMAMLLGSGALMGNREGPAPREGWGPRGVRAHANLTENLLPFAVIVLVAHVLGKTNGVTALGAEIFLGARLIHAAVYMVGVPVIRTLAYLAGLVGTIMILLQLFK